MIKRQKSIDALRTLIEDPDVYDIAITWEKHIGKETFLADLIEDGFFWTDNEVLVLGDEDSSDALDFAGKKIIIIKESQNNEEILLAEARVQREAGAKIIFLAEISPEDGSTILPLSWVSFREYAESQGIHIDIGEVLAGNSPIEKLNLIRDTYIERGSYPIHLTHPENIQNTFLEKRAIVESKLFKKEYTDFLEFTRTLAMNVWSPFKADQFAKLLNISRRKVHKYIDLLEEYALIQRVNTWVQNPDTETSRHTKFYFSDLYYLKALLGDTHYQGVQKLWAIENFIFLELNRKLDEDHSIYYYRKKSGAEIPFIIENTETGMVTPIEITTRDTVAISQVIQTFDGDYHDRVERYMVMNGRLATRKEFNGKICLILPHISI